MIRRYIMEVKKKILFLDLDGTLLNDEKKITPGNADAIRRALAAGHKIVINTGRASSSALALAKRLGLDSEGCYAITFNGACIYDLHEEKSLQRITLPIPYIAHIVEVAREMGLHVQTYAGDKVVSESDNPDLQQYLRNTGMEAIIVPDIGEYLTEDPCKAIVVDYACHGHFPEYCSRIEKWAQGKVDYYLSCRELLEFVAPGVNKGNAIRQLSAYLDIPMENTVSAGDADNDITMIQTTKIGAVMKNADSSMYQYGNYITERDNNHDGIAEIIEKFILND